MVNGQCEPGQTPSTHLSRPSMGHLRPYAGGSALSCRVCSRAGPRRSLPSRLEERESTMSQSLHSTGQGKGV